MPTSKTGKVKARPTQTSNASNVNVATQTRTSTPTTTQANAGKVKAVPKRAVPKQTSTNELQKLLERAEQDRREASTSGKTKTKPVPKQVQGDGDEKRAGGQSQEAPKSVVPAEQPAEASRPGQSGSYKAIASEEFPVVKGQLTRAQMMELSITSRHELWKRLNGEVDSERWVNLLLREELPKRTTLRIKDALADGVIKDKKPPTKNAKWCCYCGDFQPFRTHHYVGSEKCCGCGMTTKDFFIRSDNDLWGKDL